MADERISWRQLLRRSARAFLSWLEQTDAHRRNLSRICADIEAYAKARLTDTQSCSAFWAAIPPTRIGCDDPERTFNSPEAVLAYAYQHMPRRYLRMWDAMSLLTQRACLPLGSEGVRVLDIGTGPGTTAYAISDFYDELRRYGQANGIEPFVRQSTEFSTAEQNSWMATFMHHFSELSGRPGPFGATYHDFGSFNPSAERRAVFERLIREDYYDSELEEYETAYLPNEANEIAQRTARFRFVVMSYFLTEPTDLVRFEATLAGLVRDLQAGSVIVLLGAPGHRGIHKEVERLTQRAHLRRLTEVPDRLDTGSGLDAIIKEAQFHVYQHLVAVAGSSISRIEGYPDFWNPMPNKRARAKFRLNVFRKGRWP